MSLIRIFKSNLTNFSDSSIKYATRQIGLLFPQHCSIREKTKDCLNPPQFVISVVDEKGEYMIGVTCNKHKEGISGKLSDLQDEGKIPKGKIKFSSLKSVGTECIRSDPDDFIQL